MENDKNALNSGQSTSEGYILHIFFGIKLVMTMITIETDQKYNGNTLNS